MINPQCIEFRSAYKSDNVRLTEIAFAAKKHWNYPKEFYDIWHNEMTITEEYILKNLVYLALNEDQIIGFSAVVEVSNPTYIDEIYVKKGFWLDHLFIDPEYLSLRIGTKLVDFTRKRCLELGIYELLIFSEPLARGFYEKIGAKFMYETSSSIPGRMLPVYCLAL